MPSPVLSSCIKTGFRVQKSEKTTLVVTSVIAAQTTTPVTQENAEIWAQELAGELRLHGWLNKRHRNEEGFWTLEFGRPGTSEKLRVRPGDEQVTLIVEEGGFAKIMNRLHHFHGFGVDCASLSGECSSISPVWR